MTNLVKGEWYLAGHRNERAKYNGQLRISGRHIFEYEDGDVFFLHESSINCVKPIPRTITVELPKPLTEVPRNSSCVLVLRASAERGFMRMTTSEYGVSAAIDNRMAYATQAEAEAAVAALRKAGE